MKRIADIAPATGGEYEPREFRPVAAPKKPTREECKAEIKRLLGKPFVPTDPAAQGLIINALHESVQTHGHLKRIVDKLATDCERWPDVPDVRAVALETRELESRPDPNCEMCGGCGFAPTSRVIGGIRYEASRRCSCWRLVKCTERQAWEQTA